MTTLPTLTAYSGAVPDKSTMDRIAFANAVHPYLNWVNGDFVPAVQAWVEATNTLAGEIEAAAAAAAQSAWEAEGSADAAAGSAALANRWAEAGEDVEVSPGAYSAKHWAAKAAGYVAQLPDGTINDTLIAEYSAWSSQKVSDELSKKEELANKGAPGGYPSLGEDGKIPIEQLAFPPMFEKKLFGGL